MKFISKIFMAFMVTYLMWSGVSQHCANETIRRLVFYFPFWNQVAFFTVLFLMPKTTADILSLLFGWLTHIVKFLSDNLGHIINVLSKYRAGQILLAVAALSLAFIILF